MTPIYFGKFDTYPIALLCKEKTMNRQSLEKHYVSLLGRNDVVAFPLDYGSNDKAPIKVIRAHVDALLPNLKAEGVTYVLVNDGAYFKELTGEKKSEVHTGYVLPCKYEGYEDIHIILGVNYKAFYRNPDAKTKLLLGTEALLAHIGDTYVELGAELLSGNIQHVLRHQSPTQHLKDLMKFPEIEVDIEAFSLQFWLAGIATIAFSTDTYDATVFQCDYAETAPISQAHRDGYYGSQADNPALKLQLREFFDNYTGKITYHNGNYDIKVLIYELYMEHAQDYSGMLLGLKALTRNIDDTKIITYLARNSCSRSVLGLKENTHEFTGNYAQEDIKDIRRIPLKDLMQYNAIDCFATRYLKKKYWQKMVDDQQLEIYQTIFIPSVKVLLQTELVGIPLDMNRVLEVKSQLTTIETSILSGLRQHPKIAEFVRYSRNKAMIEKNLTLVRVQHTLDQYAHIQFNPGSSLQVSQFLFEECGLTPIDFTDTGAPAVGGKTLKKLYNLTDDEEIKEILNYLIDYTAVAKILNTFIAAFLENSFKKKDGVYWLHGSFILGGTVSGRLSSRQPNLQNIPSGNNNPYAKLIKSCIRAPEGWLFVGVDFASLEDRISALTTRDPQKLKVYTDGYDGHCLRAYAYFPHRMPDIVEQMNNAQDDPDLQVKIINSIADVHEDVRQDSKPPTFLLTYQGTWRGLMQNVGMSEEAAKTTEANFHKLYVVSDEWVHSKLVQASKDGYVTVAFGLRIRTPMLSKTLMSDTGSIPYEAKKEGRTAGNGLGQAYGMLNNRAAIEFQGYTIDSDYSEEILPSAPIHDAQYFVIRDDIAVVEWFNNTLIPCMQWQELPEIQHPEVKLGGNLEIYYPTWANKVSIPNGATQEEIAALCQEHEENL